MVTRTQLLDLDISGRMIDVRIANGRLLPAGDRLGVYAVGRPIEGRRAMCMAATLATGEGSVVAGRAAADLWGLLDHKGVIDVVRPVGQKRREFWLEGPGVKGRQRAVVRGSRHLPKVDRTRRHGIPVMNVARLFVDLSAILPDRALSNAFKQADMQGFLNESDLLRCESLGKGWKGTERNRALVRRRHPDTKDARTLIEALMVEINRDFDLGNPVVNKPMGRYYPDFFYEDCGLLVEVDGAETHTGRLAFLDDSYRENELRQRVRQVIRFSSEEIIEDPERVARIIKMEREKCFTLKAHEAQTGTGA
ncbi:MAG: hypothetical protein QG596_290 [Actinomycetota bacterium]|jgi:very-short-patch-repair endonuclease|nr:hypothetical protein [Actinomycetota bacterium]